MNNTFDELEIDECIELMELMNEYSSLKDLCYVLKIYLLLHHENVNYHWLWCAMERIAHGEDEIEVLDDYGYAYYDGDEK